MSPRLALALFIIGTLGGGLVIGSVTAPDGWYQALAKPSFNPPPWLFGPVWSVLYVLIGVAGWRVWRLPQRSGLLQFWAVQLLLNFAWTPTFFGLRQIGWALVVIVALLAVIVLFIARAWNRDRTAAILFLPYAAWVGFATLLTASIWRLN